MDKISNAKKIVREMFETFGVHRLSKSLDADEIRQLAWFMAEECKLDLDSPSDLGFLKDMVGAADRDPLMREVVNSLAAQIIENNRRLPPVLKVWVVRRLLGNAPAYRPPGPHAAASFLRQEYISVVVSKLVRDLGMNPTRNDASDPTSACDIVAQVAKELQIEKTSYKAVVAIWEKRKHLRIRSMD